MVLARLKRSKKYFGVRDKYFHAQTLIAANERSVGPAWRLMRGNSSAHNEIEITRILELGASKIMKIQDFRFKKIKNTFLEKRFLVRQSSLPDFSTSRKSRSGGIKKALVL